MKFDKLGRPIAASRYEARLNSSRAVYKVQRAGGWVDQAACSGHDPEMWFPHKTDPALKATAICNTCPVLDQCKDYGLAHPDLQGLWGGLTEDEREHIRKGVQL
jgi:WhiB family redox-sensing transcriptional regulator